jgi:phenylalanyl-tRNA synthetase beta chain
MAPPHWSAPSRPADAWDTAGLIEDILGIASGRRPFTRQRGDLAGFHPGQAMSWRDDAGRRVAWCGPVHPDLAFRLGLTAPVWLGEIDLDLAAHGPAPVSAYRPISNQPAAWRDLSLVIESDAASIDVLEVLERVAAPAPASMTWIDRYAGPPLAEGQVAMTLRVMLHPLDRTLTDGEVEAYRGKLLGALGEVKGVRLRRIDT